MLKVNMDTLEVGDKVYYVASHLDVNIENAEQGFVTKIFEGRVWVRYVGPQGNLTAVGNLWK